MLSMQYGHIVPLYHANDLRQHVFDRGLNIHYRNICDANMQITAVATV